jgi:amidase
MAAMQTRVIKQKGKHPYTFGPGHKVLARVRPGEVVTIVTKDCFENRLNSPEDLCTQKCVFPFLNPQTGPLFVEGAKPGDTLVVKIHEIQPDRDFAVTSLIPGFGALTHGAILNPAIPEDTKIMPIRNGEVVFSERIRLPYKPFVGTIGVAPEIESINTLTPGYWGGNMDCVETCPGHEVHFPVFVDGAHFFVGDAHATQGDGEISGCAAEMPARVTVSFEVIKGKKITWPRIVSDECLMVAGSARPLEDAARIAWRELIRWMVDDYGFTEKDAYYLLGQVGQMRVGNMVDPAYTMVAKIQKKYLKP